MKELRETEESVAPKLEVATQRLKEAKTRLLGDLERVSNSLKKAVTAVSDFNPSLQKKLTASRFAFNEVVTAIITKEEEFSERHDVIVDKYMSSGLSLPTKNEENSPGVNLHKLSPASNYIRSAYVEVSNDLKELRSKFDKLTQVLPNGSDDELVSLSPAILLSEETSVLTNSNSEIEDLNKTVREHESMITEEEKSLVDEKISQLANQISEIHSARELSNLKLVDNYSALKTLNTLVERANDIFTSVVETSKLNSQLMVFVDKLLHAQDTLLTAKRENVNVIREILLYTLGFK